MSEPNERDKEVAEEVAGACRMIKQEYCGKHGGPVIAAYREEIEARFAYSKLLDEIRFAPDIDPITGAPFFMWLEHPERGMVPTYGGPYDSYTLAERDPDECTADEIHYLRERYDHDEGEWVEGDETIGIVAITTTRFYSIEDKAKIEAKKTVPMAMLVPLTNGNIWTREDIIEYVSTFGYEVTE